MRIRGSWEDDRDATDTTGSDPGAGSSRAEGTEPVDFAPADRASAYDFIRRTLVQFAYWALSKADKGAVKAYLAKMNRPGYSGDHYV